MQCHKAQNSQWELKSLIVVVAHFLLWGLNQKAIKFLKIETIIFAPLTNGAFVYLYDCSKYPNVLIIASCYRQWYALITHV